MKFKYTKLKNARRQITTQSKFSELIDISEEHYVKIENGYSNPSVPVFLKICKAVNKPAQYFFSTNDSFLSKNQVEALMDYSEDRLRTILSILKDLYDGLV